MGNTETENLYRRFIMPVLIATTLLIGFSVPISVAFDNLLLALVFMAMLLNIPSVWHTISNNPVARAACYLFGMISIAVTYGATPWMEAAAVAGKYLDLLYIPAFMVILSRAELRQRAQYAFMMAMGLTLFLSYLVGFEIMEIQPWMSPRAVSENPAIFHNHITQNNMMALAIFLALLHLRGTATFTAKLGWGAFIVLATINVLFMVQGRTGYLVLIVLLVWFTWSTIRRNKKFSSMFGGKKILLIAIGLVGVVASVYNTSEAFNHRVTSAMRQFSTWQPGSSYEITEEPKSIAVTRRLDFYYYSAKIVQQHPIIGVGTGGLPASYAEQVNGKDAPSNPHNEFLMITVQTGLIGLVLLLYLFYTQWRYAEKLKNALEQDAARGLMLAYAVSCTLNSSLLDHADGLLFAFMTAAFFGGWESKKVVGPQGA